MGIKIVKDSISRVELLNIAKEQFGDLIKVVVDTEQEIMAIGGEMHSDGEVVLIENQGSKREHTWGINLYPQKKGDEFVEFDSIINIKPSYGNRSRNVESDEIKQKIKAVIKKLVVE